VQAVRLRRAAADGDASARLVAAREFVEFFQNEERVHLRGEEEELFPLFLRHKTAELGRRHRLFLDATRIDANQPAVPDVKPIQDEFRSAAKPAHDYTKRPEVTAAPAGAAAAVAGARPHARAGLARVFCVAAGCARSPRHSLAISVARSIACIRFIFI
jgi:hypothetical protein